MDNQPYQSVNGKNPGADAMPRSFFKQFYRVSTELFIEFCHFVTGRNAQIQEVYGFNEFNEDDDAGTSH